MKGQGESSCFNEVRFVLRGCFKQTVAGNQVCSSLAWIKVRFSS